jgi:iron complex transport system ATP-binding protein
MKQTNTWHLRLAKPAEMSGGEMQRVMIARALAQKTPVLLMDEPVSNLDIAHQLEIMRLLRTTDKTVVIVIHDLNLALQFCDRILLIHNGELLFHGPIAEGLTTENISTVYGVKTHMAEDRIIFDY